MVQSFQKYFENRSGDSTVGAISDRLELSVVLSEIFPEADAEAVESAVDELLSIGGNWVPL
jgi:hypothetical protein